VVPAFFSRRSKTSKLLEKLMSGTADANFAFDDLSLLLQNLGYTMRKTGGSHVIFQKVTAS